MTDSRRIWEIPADEFLGVRYLFEGKHALRGQSVSTVGRASTYDYGLPAPHRLLMEGFELAALANGKGFVLFDPSEDFAGVYEERMEGYLLRISNRLHGYGVGSQFLAACLDLLDTREGRCVWRPGTYSDAGLTASLRAHRLLVEDAIARGLPVPAEVRNRIDWAPISLPPRPMDRDEISGLASLGGPDLGYKEAMAAVALVMGKRARLEALYDTKDKYQRPETFVLSVGKDVFQGLEVVDRWDVVRETVDIFNERGPKELRSPSEFAFRKVSVESVCGHKNSVRSDVQDFVEKIVASKGLVPEAEASGLRRTLRRRM